MARKTKIRTVRQSFEDPAVAERVTLFAKQYHDGTACKSIWPDYCKMYHLAMVHRLIRPGRSGDMLWNKKSKSHIKRLVNYFMRYNAGKATSRTNTHLFRIAKSCGALNVRRCGRHHRLPEVEAEMDRIVLEQHAMGATLQQMAEASGYSHEKCRRVVVKEGLEPHGRRASRAGVDS